MYQIIAIPFNSVVKAFKADDFAFCVNKAGKNTRRAGKRTGHLNGVSLPDFSQNSDVPLLYFPIAFII